MEPIKLPSGATLRISLSTFSESNALLKALMVETKGLKIDPKAEIDVNLWKDLFCAALSSPLVETALAKCLARSLYDGMKISLAETFEPEAARQDYLPVCWEVGKANLAPFMKDLFAKYFPQPGKRAPSPG